MKKRAVKRFCRVFIASTIVVFFFALIEAVKETEYSLMLAPVLIAIMEAISKYIREKLKIKLPF
jgi:hypothetical protein